MKSATTHQKQVAIVTGASSGIGFATARQLQQRGYRVFGFSRRGSAPDGIEAITLDVTNEQAVRAAVQAIIESTGRIDILVNAAGFVLLGAVEEFSSAEYRQIFETNVFGTMLMTREVLAMMRLGRHGRIVNVGSIVGLVPTPFTSHYAATKHAIEGFTESLDHEVRHLGIRATLIDPGFTKTAIASATLRPALRIPLYEALTNRILAAVVGGLSAGISAETVADQITSVIELVNPPSRVVVGGAAKRLALMRRLLPAGLFSKGLRREFGLEGH